MSIAATSEPPAEHLFGDFPAPPCARLLGTRLIAIDHEARSARLGFVGRLEFCNPAGHIQGGFLTAMLDDTMGPAALLLSGGTAYTATISMTTQFLAPALPGPLFGEARVIRIGRTIGFLEATLTDAAGSLIATATASARIVPVDRLPSSEPQTPEMV